jgi:hypothetical protein
MRSPFVTVDGTHVLAPEFERFIGWANLGLPPPPILPRPAAPVGNWTAPAPSVLPPWPASAARAGDVVEEAQGGRRGELPGELHLQPAVAGRSASALQPQQPAPSATTGAGAGRGKGTV